MPEGIPILPAPKTATEAVYYILAIVLCLSIAFMMSIVRGSRERVAGTADSPPANEKLMADVSQGFRDIVDTERRNNILLEANHMMLKEMVPLLRDNNKSIEHIRYRADVAAGVAEEVAKNLRDKNRG